MAKPDSYSSKERKKGRPHNQDAIVTFLEEIGFESGYRAILREKLPPFVDEQPDKEVDFRPDVYWRPIRIIKKQHRFWEVEKVVNATTISKSILSLITTLARLRRNLGKQNAEGCLVVPEKKVNYALRRVKSAARAIRDLGGYSGKGNRRKIRLGVVSFDDVVRTHRQIERRKYSRSLSIKVDWARAA